MIHEAMNGFEYQAFYDTGKMPERFWLEEIDKLRRALLLEEITLDEYEDALEGMMGFDRYSKRARVVEVP